MTNLDAGSVAIQGEDDLTLVKKIGERADKAALRTLYDRYRRNLGSFLRSKVNDDRLVDEIYNDVMMVVWRKAIEFRGDAKVSTWIFGIAYRLCMSELRKNQRQINVSNDVELDDMPSQSSSTHSSFDQDHLQAAMQNLSANHLEVIHLAYYYGHSIAEISELIECPVNTVKTRLFHARQKLKFALADISATTPLKTGST